MAKEKKIHISIFEDIVIHITQIHTNIQEKNYGTHILLQKEHGCRKCYHP
jgi:hypothetical protein